jgi:hypothetical protein
MKIPSGLVIAKTTPNTRKICSQPFGVMSELLRFQQRYKQVPKQEHADNNKENIFKHAVTPDLFKAFAAANIKDGDGKEEDRRRDENHILHKSLLNRETWPNAGRDRTHISKTDTQ